MAFPELNDALNTSVWEKKISGVNCKRKLGKLHLKRSMTSSNEITSSHLRMLFYSERVHYGENHELYDTSTVR